ncbi:MAG: hypothetical protein IKJ36_04460 [Clostridia bacterium]|nr:hypothetical protein [Clostridia bacterium]
MKDENIVDSKNSFLKTSLLIILGFCIVIIVARYITDENFRSEIDTNIFGKQVAESSLNSIEINTDTNPAIFAYDKYIAILSKNKLSAYTSKGTLASELDVNISVPLSHSDGKYMVLGEKDGDKLYLISEGRILWNTKVEGKISGVNVNENGYVSVIVKNTIYKSVIVFYDLSGNELFRRYISSNYAICTDISEDNKYLAIGEVDYSGTIIKSYVTVISVEKAETDPDNSIVYTYESNNGEIITNINYQDKDNAVCMFNTYIQKVTSVDNTRLYDFTTDDLYVDIDLDSGVAVIDKQSSGLFSYEYEVKVKSINSKAESLYILNSDLPKSVIVSGELMAFNLGNEVRIVSQFGWLQKKYTSSKQIKNVVLGNSIAGIVYKNKIEIIEL